MRRWATSLRTTAMYAVLAGTMLVTIVAAWQVTNAWARQRAAVRVAIRSQAEHSGNLLFDEIRRTSTELRVRLLLPILAEPVDRPVTLTAFRRHVERFLGVPLTQGDSLRSIFELPSSLSSAGARAIGGMERDSVYARLVLAAVAAEAPRRDVVSDEMTLPRAAFLDYRGEPIVVVFAVRHRADGGDGSNAGAMGMAFARAPAAHRETDDVLAHVSLLPPDLAAFASVPTGRPAWRPIGGGPSAYAPADSSGGLPVPNDNERIAIRWWTSSHRLLYASSDAPDSWWTASNAVIGRFRRPSTDEWIDVAVQPAIVDAAADAAVPPSQRVVLYSVLTLGALFAAATLRELRRQQRLAQARAYFVTAVSHELRTPLAQIRMFSELLAAGRTRSPEQATRWLGVINREAVRLGGLVENVLVFGRGEADGFHLAPRAENAAALARDAVAAFTPIADARRVSVRVLAPDHLPLWADADVVRQILGNLLDNAVKYGPEGQTVTVTAERRPPPVRRRPGPLAGGAVALLVDDEGPGVPVRERARIWQPFARLHRADTTASGSGLGLGLVRELAARHGGRAWVEDAPSGGARFGVLLPACPPDGER